MMSDKYHFPIWIDWQSPKISTQLKICWTTLNRHWVKHHPREHPRNLTKLCNLLSLNDWILMIHFDIDDTHDNILSMSRLIIDVIQAQRAGSNSLLAALWQQVTNFLFCELIYFFRHNISSCINIIFSFTFWYKLHFTP